VHPLDVQWHPEGVAGHAAGNDLTGERILTSYDRFWNVAASSDGATKGLQLVFWGHPGRKSRAWDV
jgi:hypothetical protein